MDSIFDIKFTTDIEELNAQMNTYNQLPYSLRKKANDQAVNKYGKTNSELLNLMRNNILNNDESDAPIELTSSIVSEAFIAPEAEPAATPHDTNRLDQVKRFAAQNVFIICPNDYRAYSLEELKTAYNNYINSSKNQKDMANNNSIAMFGKDVTAIYSINKLQLTDTTEDDSALDIDNYTSMVSESIKNNNVDPLKEKLMELDLSWIDRNGSILEASKAEIAIYSSKHKNDISLSFPTHKPNLLPTEIKDNLGDNIDIEFLNYYEDSLKRGLINFDSDAYKKDIENIFNEYDGQELEVKLLQKGWNPKSTFEDVKYNERINQEATKYSVKNVDIIDVSKYVNTLPIKVQEKVDLEPIFIVISYSNTLFGKIINKVKNSNYSHAAIAFDASLSKLYSYGIDENYDGLMLEDIDKYQKADKNAKIKVISLFVTSNQKQKIMAKLNYFIDNQDKTKYSIQNLFRIITNTVYEDKYNLKLVCSQFVDSLLKAANIDITDKTNNLVAPADFERANKQKLFIIYEGKASKYDKEKASIIVNALKSKITSAYSLLFNEAVEIANETKNLSVLKSIKLENEDEPIFGDILQAYPAFEPKIDKNDTVSTISYNYIFKDLYSN